MIDFYDSIALNERMNVIVKRSLFVCVATGQCAVYPLYHLHSLVYAPRVSASGDPPRMKEMKEGDRESNNTEVCITFESMNLYKVCACARPLLEVLCLQFTF